MFNEYVLIDSIYPGSVYENPNNEKIRYDPQQALQLLAEAGWKDRDAQGRLVKNGRPLTIELALRRQGVGALLHDLPGGPAQGRHHAEPAAGHVRDAVQAARRAHVRHGVHRVRRRRLSRTRRPACCPSSPTRRTPTTSPGFKNTRVDEIIDAVRQGVRLREARRRCSGARRHRHQRASLHSRVDGALRAHASTGTSSASRRAS